MSEERENKEGLLATLVGATIIAQKDGYLYAYLDLGGEECYKFAIVPGNHIGAVIKIPREVYELMRGNHLSARSPNEAYVGQRKLTDQGPQDH